MTKPTKEQLRAVFNPEGDKAIRKLLTRWLWNNAKINGYSIPELEYYYNSKKDTFDCTVDVVFIADVPASEVFGE